MAVFTTGPAPTEHLDAEVVQRLAEPRGSREAARRSRAARTPTSISSRSRLRRSTSSQRRRGARARDRLRRERSRLAGARRRGVEARCRRGPRGMSHPRHSEPLPLGDAGSAVLEGADGSRARRGRRPARACVRAREAHRAVDLVDARRASVELEPRRGACGRSPRRRGGSRAVRRLRRYRELQRARPADHRAGRRRDRYRQVDGRDRGRLSTRDHARHLDRLRPPDDARVLLGGVHAVDPLLELRGGGGLREPEQAGRSRRRGLPRADAERARRRARLDRPRARGGLVDGARGRPPRPGHAAAGSRARSSSSACSRSRTRRSTRRTSSSATPRLDGVRPVDEVHRAARRHPT